MTIAATVPATTLDLRPRAAAPPVDIALLGLGRVGAAVALGALDPLAALEPRLRIVAALVRDPVRPRAHQLHERVRLSRDPEEIFACRPRIIVEALGGTEPARTLVAEALKRGIAVVTSNKSLMAAHGAELAALAARHRVPLRYEASVIAGVPFLGTFARRPIAASVRGVTGIVNGTSNFIVTKMEAEWQDAGAALAEAQRLGLAEPDPRSDVKGIDAAEKLTVLIRHFSGRHAAADRIETVGIDGLRAADLEQAREFGGAIKPIAYADWSSGELTAFVGPAFVHGRHKLASIEGVENAIVLAGATGELCYSGPGAGPAATAATMLDDVLECLAADEGWTTRRGCGDEPSNDDPPPCAAIEPVAPPTPWFVRLEGRPALPTAARVSDFLDGCGVPVSRVSAGHTHRGAETSFLLTRSCGRDRLECALSKLAGRTGCDTFLVRALPE